MKSIIVFTWVLLLTVPQLACRPADQEAGETPALPADRDIEQRLAKYTSVEMTTDLEVLSENQRRMIPLLIEAAEAMDEAFWRQAYGDKEELLDGIDDPAIRRFVEINYGPWDRLADNEPFVDGAGPKPATANFYPQDVTAETIEEAAAAMPELKSLYTMVRRDGSGELIAVPYSEFFADPYGRGAEAARRRRACRGRGAQEVSRAARRRPALRRLLRERLRLDGHEVQYPRRRDRPDRDL